jgi:hypothetical protein
MLRPSDLPFTETISDDCVVRHFSDELTQGDLPWHRDREDRWVTAEHYTDWMLQRDNELPCPLWGQSIFVRNGEFHRLIKGTGELVCRIRKL